MQELLIACGDVELLKQILTQLPQDRYKPIATKRGAGIAAKLAGRGVPLAIVYEQLEDVGAGQLLGELRALNPPPATLVLTSGPPPKEGPFDKALRWPMPGPVFRNAVQSLVDQGQPEYDLEQWRAFYRELQARNAALPTQNYFEVMGLQRGAKHDQITRAFDAISLRFHPDRYNSYRTERWGAAVFEECNKLYKVQTEAYGVLTDRRLRKKYEAALDAGELRLAPEDTAGQDTGPRSLDELASDRQAKKFLKLAQSAIATQNWTTALQNLKFAQSMEPGNAAIQSKIDEVQAKLG
jgi:hypothetical protein